MKKLLILFLLLALIAPAFGAVEKVSPEPKTKITAVKEAGGRTAEVSAIKKFVTFKDLKPANPAYPYVMKMVVSYEAISGYPDGTFRGDKTINRAEFSKIITNALAYLEKKYDLPLADEPATAEVKFKDLEPKHWSQPFVAKLVAKYKILSGYPDGTFKPNKTINRFELATVLAKTLKLIYERYEIALPTPEAIKFGDVKPKHWAQKDIELLAHFKIMQGIMEKKKLFFAGTKNVSRFEVAITGAKLIGESDTAIAALPKDKLEALLKKYRPSVALPPTPSRVEKALEITTKPQATISGSWGNIYESASGTNNWLGFGGSASYGDIFQTWMLSGNYEISGRYRFNQINYMVPAAGGGVAGGVVNENRYELELNTVYPVVEFFGISGKLLLGAKYINLSNPIAPSSFTGFNAGIVTAVKAFDRNFLVRAFYSLPLVRTAVTPSVLGQPNQLFDYEVSLDAEIFSYPVLFGLSGEIMNLSGGFYRYYNNFFVRYFIL